jgi:oligopeptide transport system ATP-binding protein
MKNLLEIRNLKINFNLKDMALTVVDNINLDIGSSEVLVLAGESGSGKTVSALSITGLLPKNAKIVSGNINFGGQDLVSLDESSLSRVRGKEIAYIFQEPTSFLNPVYTIGDQIVEAIMLHQGRRKKEAWDQARTLLDLVKINQPQRVLFNYPHQLSGGMNQRAFIAMALACKPKLLIADEPTTSLDVTIEAQILELLMSLKNKFGFSLLFITHNLSIAKRIADRIALMHKGRIVEEGDREHIFNSPQHFHTRELISAYEKIGKI